MNEELSGWINVSNEESQDDVNRKKQVYNVVYNVELRVQLRIQERYLEGADPCRVRHQHHHPCLPTPTPTTTSQFIPFFFFQQIKKHQTYRERTDN